MTMPLVLVCNRSDCIMVNSVPQERYFKQCQLCTYKTSECLPGTLHVKGVL